MFDAQNGDSFALTSLTRRSAEEYVSEDWAAVARAINRRAGELDLKQRELAERSGVSQAIVREIQHDTVRRRRGARTLEALSLALEWHPRHLAAVLAGEPPPAAPNEEEPQVSTDDRLTAIEAGLTSIAARLERIDARLARLTNHGGER